MNRSTLVLSLVGGLLFAPVLLSFFNDVSTERLITSWCGSLVAALMILLLTGPIDD